MRLRILVLIISLFGTFAGAAPAAEPILEFLQGLQQRGYYDTALQYLDQLETRSNLSDDLKKRLQYERAQILLQSANELTNLDAQRRQLDEAQAAFERFVQIDPSGPLAARANSARGRILLEKARVEIWEAEKPSNEANRVRFREAARRDIGMARRIFEQARDQHKRTWEQFPSYIPEQDREQRAARVEAEAQFIEAQHDLAQSSYWEAQTYDRGSQERKDRLTKVAKEFEQIHQQYRSQIGGLYARIWEGKCYEEQDEIGVALGIYDEILKHPDTSQPMQRLQDTALRFRLICLNHDSRKDYQLVVQEVDQWLQQARARARTNMGIGIQWESCRAYEAIGNDRSLPENTRKNALNQALSRARMINRFPGELKTPSSAMIQRLMVALNREPGDPRDFDAAYGTGGQLFDEINQLNSSIQQAVAAGKNAEAVQLQSTLQATAGEMARIYDLALKLVNSRSDATLVNIARLRLAYGYLLQQRFFDAAVVAEHQMNKYGEEFPEVAREAGFIAMTAYEQAYQQAASADREAAAQWVIRIADQLAERWPESERANDARNAVAAIFFQSGALLEAVEWWEKIPKGTSLYVDAQIRSGKAYWRQYVIEAGRPEDERVSPQLLQEWKESAIRHLENGLAEAQSKISADTVFPDDLVGAKLILTNIRNLDGVYSQQEGGPAGALELLTEEPHSILKAVEVQEGEQRPRDPAMAKSRQMASLAYQQLLRAYIGLKDLDTAREAREKLESIARGQDDAALTQVFVDFGRELQKELERLKASEDIGRLNDVRAGFESFLNDLFQRQDGQSFYSLLWIAETYTSLGEGSQDDPQKSAQFFTRAAEAYQSIVDRANQNAEFATPQQLLASKLRLVSSLRRRKAFPEAEQLIVEILRVSPNAPDAQFEAANLYQDWGASDSALADEKYRIALYGKKDPIHIWGWSYAVQSIQRVLNTRRDDERLQQLNFDARYRLAETERDFGMTSADRNQGQDHLARALSSITGFQRVSSRWPDAEYDRFNQLYRSISTQSGQTATDLPRELARVERTTPADDLQNEPSDDLPAETLAGEPVVASAAAPKKSSSVLAIVSILLVTAAVIGLFIWSSRPKKKTAGRGKRSGKATGKSVSRSHLPEEVSFDFVSPAAPQRTSAGKATGRPAGPAERSGSGGPVTGGMPPKPRPSQPPAGKPYPPPSGRE